MAGPQKKIFFAASLGEENICSLSSLIFMHNMSNDLLTYHQHIFIINDIQQKIFWSTFFIMIVTHIFNKKMAEQLCRFWANNNKK